MFCCNEIEESECVVVAEAAKARFELHLKSLGSKIASALDCGWDWSKTRRPSSLQRNTRYRPVETMRNEADGHIVVLCGTSYLNAEEIAWFTTLRTTVMRVQMQLGSDYQAT